MRSVSVYILSLFILYNTQMVNADYTCLCNNGDFPKKIFQSQNSGSDVIGYIKFCKETSAVTNQHWLSVIYQHQIGYIQNDADIVVSRCVGTPRPEDDLTTVQPYKSVLSTRITPNITEGTTKPVSPFLTSVVLTSINSIETNAMSSPMTIKTMHTSATKPPTTDVNALANTTSVMQATLANTETVSTAVTASATKIALTTATAVTTSRTATTETAPTTASTSTTTTAATNKTASTTAEALTTTSTTTTATTHIHPISGKMRWVAIAIFFSSVISVRSDYSCVCSYSVETNVYSKPTVQGDIIGYMYEFDCKPVGGQSDNMWLSVAYEHQLGYIEKNDQLQTQTCQGAVPDEDKLAPTTTASTMKPATTTTHELTTTETSTATTEEITSTATPAATTTTEQTTTSTTTPTQTTTRSTTPTQTTTRSTTPTQTTTRSTTPTQTTTRSTTPTQTTTRSTTPTQTSTTEHKSSPSTTTEESSTTHTNIVTTTLKPSTASTRSSSTQSPTTQTTTHSPTQTMTTTNNPIPSANTIQGHLEMCSTRIQQAAMKDHAILAQFGDNCYEVDQSSVSWTHAESICKQNGGHLAHIANQKEQDFIYNFLVKHHSHTAWIGLHDRNYEESFQWISGDAVTYTNWAPGRKNYMFHGSEDCVFMSPTTGEWDDTQCGGSGPIAELLLGHRHAYICQFATVNAPTASILNPALDGNVHLCGNHLIHQASSDAGTLANYGQSCYEVVPNTRKTWSQSESFCHSRGGHLAHISNTQEQNFIQGFLQRYSPQHAVWIGLTDKHSEGHFHWTSGDAAHYTNWVPNHISNFVHHNQEDCVAFIPYKNGQWDDIPCGNEVSSFHHTHAVGEVHPVLCQYSTSSGPSLVG